MILERFYDRSLAQASYIVGCAGTGEAVVIDPLRDVQPYLEFAAQEGLKIVAVTETHIHADYISGTRELSDRTGAQMLLSDEGDADWKYAFADDPKVTLLKDGSQFKIGRLVFDVIKTPGHTPEHITFVLTDTPASSRPVGAFTGDFIFASDVGRPDLLERAAGFTGTMEAGGRTLFESLQKFAGLASDDLLLWPAHGAGSACGKSLGGVPVTTWGYEKRAGWAFQGLDQEGFVAEVLSGQPEPPAYFKEMKRINKEGPKILGGSPRPPRLSVGLWSEVKATSPTVIDLRRESDWIPGSLKIGLGKSFVTWAGSLAPLDQPVYFIADSESEAMEAACRLSLIGFDDLRGWFGPEAADSTVACDLASFADLGQSDAQILDVRGRAEAAAGSIPGSINIPLGELAARANELDRTRPLIVHCAGGSRSAIAVSVLRGLGFDKVRDLSAGYQGWAGMQPT